ncbi:hypothetical protein ABPG75_013934 [Micractinium tetrahymenae]
MNGSSSDGSGADGVSAVTRQRAEDACTIMQAALGALCDSKDASCPLPTRQQVAAAVQLVRTEVAKMGLVYNQAAAAGAAPTSGGGAASTSGGGAAPTSASSAPSDAEAEALLQGLQQAVCTLCMVYMGIAASDSAGPTLRASLDQTATAAVESCVALVRGAVLGGARDAQLMMLSGFCLEMLEAAEKAPLDSRTAIGRAITQVLKQLADAAKELEEEVQAAAEAAEEGGDEEAAAATTAAAGSDADSDAGFGLFTAEAFSAGQLAVARRVQRLLAAVLGVAKSVVKLLLAEREGLSPEAVEGWESMLYHIKGLGPVVDDLSAATYPPQDAQELASAAEALATSCELLRDECPAAGAASSSGGGGDGAQQQAEEGGAAAPAAALLPPLEAVQAAHRELAAELASAAAGEAAASAAAAAAAEHGEGQ